MVTIETLAPSKLLNYVQKDQIIRFLTPRRYSEIEHELKTTLNKTRVNLKDIKKHLATQDDFVSSLRRHPYGQEAFQKYRDAAERMRNINRTDTSRRDSASDGRTETQIPRLFGDATPAKGLRALSRLSAKLMLLRAGVCGAAP